MPLSLKQQLQRTRKMSNSEMNLSYCAPETEGSNNSATSSLQVNSDERGTMMDRIILTQKASIAHCGYQPKDPCQVVSQIQ